MLKTSYLRSTNSNRVVVPRIKTKTRSRAFSISGPALLNALPVPIRITETILTVRELLNRSHLIWLSHTSSSATRLPVDEPALTSIMTHAHARNLCASELVPLTI